MNREKRIAFISNTIKLEYINEMDKLISPEKGLKDIYKFKKKILWALDNINPRLVVSFGNLKLPKSTMIINLSSWFNCIGKKEKFCEICEECYDKAPEVMFKERIESRMSHEIYWRASDWKELTKDIIEKIGDYNEHTNKYKVKKIRWAEVGEIRHQAEFNKIVKISNAIYRRLGIKSYIYTHNEGIDFNLRQRPGLIVNGSGFMVDNEYRVVKKDLIEKEFHNLNDLSNKRECICDCNICSYCSEANGLILIEELR